LHDVKELASLCGLNLLWTLHDRLAFSTEAIGFMDLVALIVVRVLRNYFWT